MRTKPCESHDSHIKAAREGILVVFQEPTIVYVGDGRKRRTKGIEEGTVYTVKSIETDNKGTLKIMPWEGNEPMYVKSTEVHVYMGRLPDWRMELYLEPAIGYQADTFAGAQPLGSRCRDFGGSYEDRPNFLIERLERLSEGWLNMFKRPL